MSANVELAWALLWAIQHPAVILIAVFVLFALLMLLVAFT